MTETLPAGLLPQLAAGLDVSEGGAGQLVSAYAIGTVLAAIPTITLTRGTRRKPLLLAGLLGFLVANAVTAASPSFTVALVARFVGGAFSGLLWGMLAGYARRIAAPEHAGVSREHALTGTPVALSVGPPLGAWLGSTVVDGVGAPVLPAGMIAFTLIALVTVGFGRRAAFPTGR
ncbi:MFS transporter [Streptomyces mutabilis]|uniref:MFS transporter n=1 Tax=Streptomyces mutabilis TaxID=67332 RepID=UPI00379CCD3A